MLSMKHKKVKKDKKKKLESVPKINRRLFKLWSETVRERANHTCEYCGVKKGETNSKGGVIKIDAHHLMNRSITNCPLKFDIRNAIAVCSKCHKFSPDNSFHLNPVVTIRWMERNRKERIDFVEENYKSRVDLQNREILAKIQEHLEKKEGLDLVALKELDDKIKEINAFNNKTAEQKPTEQNINILD